MTLSVVIPAHNEANVIGPCLDRLLDDAARGEFEIVVVSNGSTDDTAEQARAHPYRVTVLETDEPSKVAALNLGDRQATTYPRLYLDADVILDTFGARALAGSLDNSSTTGPRVLAAAPAIRMDTSHSPWLVRSYLRIWADLPSVRFGLAGRGAFVLSREGRDRFGEFPAILADDLFIDRLFEPSERTIVDEVTSRVAAPRSLSDLVARKARVFTGNIQLGLLHPPSAGGQRSVSDRTAWLGVVKRAPARLVDIPAYALVTLTAKRRAHRRIASRDYSWGSRRRSARRSGR